MKTFLNLFLSFLAFALSSAVPGAGEPFPYYDGDSGRLVENYQWAEELLEPSNSNSKNVLHPMAEWSKASGDVAWWFKMTNVQEKMRFDEPEYLDVRPNLEHFNRAYSRRT